MESCFLKFGLLWLSSVLGESRNAAAPACALTATVGTGGADGEVVPAGRSAGPCGNTGSFLWERS